MNLPNEMKIEILKNCKVREFDILRKFGEIVCEEKSVLCEVMWNTYSTLVMDVCDKRVKYSEYNLKMVKEWDKKLMDYYKEKGPILLKQYVLKPVDMLHYENLFKEMLKEKKEDILEWMIENNRVDKKELLRDGLGEDVKLLEYILDKCEIDDNDLLYIFNMDSLKLIIDKGMNIPEEILEHNAYEGTLDVLRYLVEKRGMALYEDVLISALENNQLEVIRYLIEIQKMLITDNVLITATSSSVEILRYIIEKKEDIEIDNVYNENMYLLRYFRNLPMISESVWNDMLENAVENLNIECVMYLVDEKKVEITRYMFVILDDIRRRSSLNKKVLRFLRDRYKRQ